jgi:hypothetical protein
MSLYRQQLVRGLQQPCQLKVAHTITHEQALEELLEKQALMAGAARLGGAAFKNTGGMLAKSWGGLTKGIGGLLERSGARGAANHANSVRLSQTGGAPMSAKAIGKVSGGKRQAVGNWLSGKGEALHNTGTRMTNDASRAGQTFGKGWGGRGARLAIGAGPFAAFGASVPGVALHQALKAPEMVADQRRRGAGEALASYNQMPMWKRLGAAASTSRMEAGLQERDPGVYKYYQQYMGQ